MVNCKSRCRLFVLFVIITLFENICIANSDVKTIAVGNALDNRCELNLSQIAKSVEYIPLGDGRNSEALLTDSRRLFLHVDNNSDLYVFQLGRGEDLLKVFSKSGIFKSSHINYGRGPGEYTNGVKYILCENSVLLLLDYHKILIYKNLLFEKSIDLFDFYPPDSRFVQIVLLDSCRILVGYTLNYKEYISIFDIQTNKAGSSVLLGNIYAGPSGSIVLNGEIRQTPAVAQYRFNKSFDQSCICASRGRDSIFAVKYNTAVPIVSPMYSIDFDRYRGKSAIEDFYVGGTTIIEPGCFNNLFTESKEYLLFCVIFSLKRYPNIPQLQRFVPIVYDKVNGKTYSLKFNKKFNTVGFVNDIDGGMPFWPQYHIDNCLYKFVDAADFIKMASVSSSAKMKEIAATLTEESNPVLVKVELK